MDGMTAEQKLQDRLRHWAGIEAATFPTSGLIACLNEAINRINETERQLAEAQKDQARLDWMMNNGAYVVTDGEVNTVWVYKPIRQPAEGYPFQPTYYDTPRQAIDAAMKEK